MTKMIHSYWAYIVLIVLIITVITAIMGWLSKKEYKANNLRIALFALIAAHIQLIIGFIAYFTSDFYATMSNIGMGEVMKNSELRKPLVEHPSMIIIAIILITIGFSKHKKKTTDKAKFETISIFYGIALLIILGMIPWKLWLMN